MDKLFVKDLKNLFAALKKPSKEVAVMTRSTSSYSGTLAGKLVVNEVSLENFAFAQYCMSCVDMSKHTVLDVPMEGLPKMT